MFKVTFKEPVSEEKLKSSLEALVAQKSPSKLQSVWFTDEPTLSGRGAYISSGLRN